MFEPILNSTILGLRESSTLAINQKARKLRADGQAIYHFGFGQSPFSVPLNVQKALYKNTFRKDYLPTLGLPELREAFCEYYQQNYGYEFKPDCVLVGPGSKELIFQAIFILEGPLLIPAPSWVSYGPQAHIRGKHVHTILTKKENAYKLTAIELKKACDSLRVNRQKILILNNPNNPTGVVYTDEEILSISKICREEGVIVISDEIYALIDYSGNKFQGFSKHYPEGTIVTSGLSKGHSAGGYRLGLLAVPENMRLVMKCLSSMVSETFSAVSAPIQYSAVAAYSGDKEVMEYIAQCTRIHKITTEYLYKRLSDLEVGCVKPTGAFYLFPDFVDYIPQFKRLKLETSQQMCDYFLNHLGIAVLPSNDFYYPEDFLACRMASVDYEGEKVYQMSLRAKKLDFEFVEKNCPNLKSGMDALQGFLKSLAI